ncbi:MAG: PKD domain-containing protein [Kangiellaceae bacterium]|nr:PKD domain-containing protein [Kangiellaceae bacterium]
MDSNQTRRGLKLSLKLSALALSCALAGTAVAEPAQRFIVKYKDASQVKASQQARIQKMMARLSTKSGLSLSHIRKMGLENRHVINLKSDEKRDKFLAMMRKLRLDPNVLSIEEDVLMQPNFVPNDEFYDLQWHYHEATGGMNAEDAWDTNDGTGVIVAVIDTGITDHSDLNANVLPGYDFIDDLDVSNDGDGRDADASDPGDWVAAFECGFNFAQNSSWHGTHTAGTIAAVTNNTQGVAGVAYGAKIVPVRVLGQCGGFLSDIADGIVWASGGSVDGVPENANPAQVINMSLGGSGACDATYQDAIDIAVANGTTVVVSAGNSTADSIDFRPASCDQVINVAANDREGNLADYSNFGSIVDVTAPGGETSVVGADGVASTLNDGTETPGTENYVYYQGTSMAAPHVAGTVALMYQANPNITPAEVEAALKATARPMPGTCDGGCGAGIIDARAALDSLGSTNAAPSAGFTASVSGSDVTFTDSSSDSDGSIANWSWDFGDGNSSTEQNPQHTYAADGSYTVTLTVTDNEDATDDDVQTVIINANNVAPSSNFTFLTSDLQVTFTDSSSDSDGTVASWSWDFGDGNTSSDQNPVHDYTAGGTYTVALTVTDDLGSTDVSTQSISVVAPNAAPTADFSFTATELTVDFTDSSSDSDGSVDSWSWDFGDGNTSSVQNPSHSYTSAGTYTASVTVTDNEGATDTSSQTVTVSDGSVSTGGFTETDVSPARGENLSYTIDVPAGATLLEVDISGGTGDADLVINFGSTPTRTNNDCIEQGAGNTHSCSFTNPDEGTWFIIVRGASDSSGVQLDAYWTAEDVGNIAPTAGFSVSTLDLEATFSDSSSDSDGSVDSYSWDFGDGNSSTSANPVHSYSTAGTYSVSLTVTDNEGASDTETQSVTVSESGGNTGGFTETGLSPARGENLSYTIDVPAGATSLVVDTSGGTGNVDLVINFGSAPTRTNNDCIEQAAGNTHNCTITNPSEGTWFIIVRGASASTNAQLDAYWFD